MADRYSEHWYLLHLKPRCEKKARTWASAFHLPCILPTMFETRKIQRRKVVVELPIFPGYIFIRMPPGARLSVLESGTVARFIYVEKPRTLVHQLHQVVKAAKSAEKLSAAPMYTEGDAVRIKYGPLKGVEGRFKRLQGKSGLLVLNVEMLGCAVEVTVDVTDCKKL